MDPVGVQFAPIISDNHYDLHGPLSGGYTFPQTNLWTNREDRNYNQPSQNTDSILRLSDSVEESRNFPLKASSQEKGKMFKDLNTYDTHLFIAITSLYSSYSINYNFLNLFTSVSVVYI